MQQKELAKLLGISPGMVSRHARKGMPTDTLDRAKKWRKRHLEPGRIKGSRYDPKHDQAAAAVATVPSAPAANPGNAAVTSAPATEPDDDDHMAALMMAAHKAYSIAIDAAFYAEKNGDFGTYAKLVAHSCKLSDVAESVQKMIIYHTDLTVDLVASLELLRCEALALNDSMTLGDETGERLVHLRKRLREIPEYVEVCFPVRVWLALIDFELINDSPVRNAPNMDEELTTVEFLNILRNHHKFYLREDSITLQRQACDWHDFSINGFPDDDE